MSKRDAATEMKMGVGRMAAMIPALTLTLAVVLCVACTGVSSRASDSSAAAPLGARAGAGAAVAAATFSLPPAGSGTPFGTTSINLPARGYVEEEFLASGVANRYRVRNREATAEVVDGGHAYGTRILVRRPINPARFNGVVVVEWYNVSLQHDADFIFAPARRHLIDQGYAWVGVSAQLVGANALKAANPARYASVNLVASNVDPNGGDKLDASGDVLSWDVYAQIGAALRRPDTSGARPLGNLKPKIVIAAGESQSAFRMTTYYNAIQPYYPDVYDGYFTYDRVQVPQRTDMKAKHVSFGSEGWDSPPPDNANLRLWEVAGASHVSVDEMMPYMNEQILRSGSFRYNGGPPSDVMPALAGCGSQPVLSRIPNGDVVSAGIAALVRWVRDGKAPPTGPRMVRDSAGKLIRDADGRVTGGIRLAAYDAPMSKSVGFNTGGPNCTVMGSHIDFTPAEMCRRYGSPQGYVTKVTEVTRKAQRDGFVLKSDADRTIADAAGLKFSCR